MRGVFVLSALMYFGNSSTVFLLIVFVIFENRNLSFTTEWFLYYFIVSFVAKLPYARFRELFVVFTTEHYTPGRHIGCVDTCNFSLHSCGVDHTRTLCLIWRNREMSGTAFLFFIWAFGCCQLCWPISGIRRANRSCYMTCRWENTHQLHLYRLLFLAQ